MDTVFRTPQGSDRGGSGDVAVGGSGDVAAASSESLGIPIPSVNSCSSSSTVIALETNSLQKLSGSVQRVVFNAADSGSCSGLTARSIGSFGDLEDGGDNEEDNDKFFDAPEDSPESLSLGIGSTLVPPLEDGGDDDKFFDAPEDSPESLSLGIGSTSQGDLRPENLPTITPGKKTCVSSDRREREIESRRN